uniref:SLH domain-containing protein n=1 Tax=uncultured Bacillota bacterium TaxID=344338 RepID=A0A650F4F1_9FIRM|nr:hypothetical protein Firmicute1046_0210 [uncultured Firmicutes bacterium]
MRKNRLLSVLTAIALLCCCISVVYADIARETNVVLTVEECSTMGADGIYHLRLRAEVTYAGGNAAGGERVALVLLGNQKTDLSDYVVPVKISGVPHSAYLYYVTEGKADADGICNFDFSTFLPEMRQKGDFLYAYAGSPAAFSSAVQGGLELPGNPKKVKTTLRSGSQEINSFEVPKTDMRVLGEVEASVFDMFGTELEIQPEAWKIYSYAKDFSRAIEVADTQMKIENGQLIVYPDANVLANRKIAVEALYRDLNQKTIVSEMADFPHDIMVQAPAAPYLVIRVSQEGYITIPDEAEQVNTLVFTAYPVDAFGAAVQGADIHWTVTGLDKDASAEQIEFPSQDTGESYVVRIRSGAKNLRNKTFAVSAVWTMPGTEITCEPYRVQMMSNGETPYHVEISGESEITVSNSDIKENYTAKLVGQDGKEYTAQSVLWQLANPYYNVSMDRSGTLKVFKGVESGTAVITAEIFSDSLPTGRTEKGSFVVTLVSRGSGSNSGSGGSGGGGGGGSSAMIFPEKLSQTETPNGNIPPLVSQEPVIASDLTENHWAAVELQKMLEHEYIRGDGESGDLRPDDNITREELAAVLLRVLQIPVKAGVDLTVDDNSSEWAAGILSAAQEEGILHGDENGNLNGKNFAQRAEVVLMLSRALQLPYGSGGVLENFADADTIPVWAQVETAGMIQAGLLKGYEDNTLRLNENVTRAEAFVLISRCMGE